MLNVYCLKSGTKYSYVFVNRLFNMVKRHLSCPFNFHCFTEDDRGIDPFIKILPLPNLDVDKWWNKMVLFDESVVKGSGMFFDLDIVIQSNIDSLFAPDNCMKFLPTPWIDLNQLSIDTIGNKQRFCSINSSVLCWDEKTSRQPIYDYFIKHKEKITTVFTGIDSFIEHRFPSTYCLYESHLASSYWVEGYKNTPLILFDGKKEKQDLSNDKRIERLWI